MKEYAYNETLQCFKMMMQIHITGMGRLLGFILREKLGYIIVCILWYWVCIHVFKCDCITGDYIHKKCSVEYTLKY